MRILIVLSCLGVAACGAKAVKRSADARSGGDTTVIDTTNLAYSQQAHNLLDEHGDSFSLGHSLFERNWVTAPATTADIDGLGPVFNQRACSGCHSHDGRSPLFDKSGAPANLLFRLSVAGVDAHGGPQGDAIYGGQLRPNGILAVPGEGEVVVTYEEQAGTYADGTAYSLSAPHYELTGWAYGEPEAGLMFSPRMGPATIGLGLLEAIAEADLRANADRHDADGVVGRANEVWSVEASAMAIGRFGWKANVPTVRQQTAGALQGDMGITSSLFTEELCTAPMTACLAAKNGGSPEIDDMRLDAMALYMRTLAVPARRALSDPQALHGDALFTQMGCASCHVTTFVTGTFEGLPEVSEQTIHPYTDLLLHDMGPELADGRPDFGASGSEWRTPPLWGIGLLQTVNDHERLMHDGRARGLEEAILWHGGEGLAARERFRQAPAEDRAALIAFLRSL